MNEPMTPNLRQRLDAFIAASPKQEIRILQSFGPYSKGDVIIVTAATANDYVEVRRKAEYTTAVDNEG